MGDDSGLQYFAESFRRGPRADWASRFEIVRNAKLISMVGDLLFKEEVFEWAGGDLGLMPTQSSAAVGILETLKHAPLFQPDIQQWGHALSKESTNPRAGVLKILREWYRENEERLKAGDFEGVRPGRMPITDVSAATPQRFVASERVPSIATGALQAHQLAVMDERNAPTVRSPWIYVAAALSCITLALGLWAICRCPRS